MDNLLCWQCGNAFNGKDALFCDYCGVPIGQDWIDVTAKIRITAESGVLIVGPLQPNGLRSIVHDGDEPGLSLDEAQVMGLRTGLVVEVWDGNVPVYRSTPVLKVQNVE